MQLHTEIFKSYVRPEIEVEVIKLYNDHIFVKNVNQSKLNKLNAQLGISIKCTLKQMCNTV